MTAAARKGRQGGSTAADRTPAGRRWIAGAAIFAVALLLRLLHLLQASRAPFFPLLLGDGARYDGWAREIAAGDWIGAEIFYQAPLYPYFLATVYTLFGDSLWTARIVQAVLSAAACALVAAATRRLFSPRAGLLAGLMLALYAPSIFLDGLIQKSVLDVFLLSLALWLLARILTGGSTRLAWLSLGCVLGALVLARENALVFVAALAVWAVVNRTGPLRREPLLAGILVLGLAVPLLPVALRNLSVGGEFHLTTSQLGPNFFIGNNPGATGSYVPLRPGRGDAAVERSDATDLAQRALGRELTPAEVSDYWSGRAFEYIREQPGDWLVLMARKTAYLFSSTELVDTEDQQTWAEWSAPLRLTGYIFHFGVLLPLAALGLCLSWKRRRELWLLPLMLACYAASVVAFYVVARYRYPLVPLLVPFAALALARLPELPRSLSRRAAAACIAVALTIALLSNWPLVPVERMRAVTLTNIGSALERASRYEEAVGYYRQALAIEPDHANAHFNLGIIAQRQGDDVEAMERYRQAIESDSRHARAHANLAVLELAHGDPDAALLHCREALAAQPDLGRTHLTWARALEQLGRSDDALEHFRSAARLEPGYVPVHLALGEALLERGIVEEAILRYRHAVTLEPGNPRTHFQLGEALQQSGSHLEAAAAFVAAWRRLPESPTLLRRMARSLRSAGRTAQALELLRAHVRENKGSAAALAELSWILSTDPNDTVRDARRAVRQAEAAARITRRRDGRVLDALAAAYANAGRFDEAVATATRAAAMARQLQGPAAAGAIEGRISLYRQSRPYRESSDDLR